MDLDSPSTMLPGSLARLLAKSLQEFRKLSPAPPSLAELEAMLKCFSNGASSSSYQDCSGTQVRASPLCVHFDFVICLGASTRFKKCYMLLLLLKKKANKGGKLGLLCALSHAL